MLYGKHTKNGILIINIHHFMTSQHTVYISSVYLIVEWCATSGAGTAYPSGAPEFTPGF
jgi:hypothetical protein